jgi:predicted metal-binding protein
VGFAERSPEMALAKASAPGSACLYICETCARDVPVTSGEKTHGQALMQAVRDELRAADLGPHFLCRAVICLNGCPKPCNVALRAPGRYTLRVGQLTLSDARRIVDLAREYSSSPLGDIPRERWPAGLWERLTVRTPPP